MLNVEHRRDIARLDLRSRYCHIAVARVGQEERQIQLAYRKHTAARERGASVVDDGGTERDASMAGGRGVRVRVRGISLSYARTVTVTVTITVIVTEGSVIVTTGTNGPEV